MIRLQLDIDQEANEEIGQYMLLGSVKTKKEFFNNALALLKWAMDERAEGRIIASVDEDEEDPSYKEITMPILDSAERKVKRAVASAGARHQSSATGR